MDEYTGKLGGGEPGAPDTWRFSIAVAKAWEEAFFSHTLKGTRQIAIRSAMTFSPDRGGVFDMFSKLVRLGLGGAQGPGTQYVSWIHHRDFSRALQWLIDHPGIAGVVNLASPNPLPNREFLRGLRRAWGVPFGLAAPKWALELGAIFLRTETELILKSRRVIPARLLESGFDFEYPDWQNAANDLVTRSRKAARPSQSDVAARSLPVSSVSR
jgi:uncharacterized protein